ncbi:P-loop NTPase fold protein [Streptomyces sp. HD]|nr:P-loop NTPase fold protein [Streptomyces sp. HD]
MAEPEFATILDQGSTLTTEEARRAAEVERPVLLDDTQEAEDAYWNAVHQECAFDRLASIGSVAGCGLVALILATGAAWGWDEALKDARAHDHAVSILSALGNGFLGVAALFVVTWLVTVITGYAFSGLLRRYRDVEEMWMGSLALAYLFTAVLCSLFIGDYIPEIVWQLVRGEPLGSHGYDWGVWVKFCSLGLFALPVLFSVKLAARATGHSGVIKRWSRMGSVYDSIDPGERFNEWRETLRQVLLSFMRVQINERSERLYSTVLTVSDAPGLRGLRAVRDHVSTAADEQLAAISAGMDSGSIALSGPRGAGKTQLLHMFCAGAQGGRSRRLSVVESVPVLFDRREFMLHLFYKLCDLAIEEGLGTAQEAERHKRSIRYLQTLSDQVALSAGWRSWNLSANRATALAQQPQTYPEIVDDLKGFLTRTARSLSEEGRHLVIAIDELDRIEPASTARTFLNELKAVFDVPKCLYLLAVSDEVFRDAALAPVGHRDVFDSAIDEVVRVEPLDQKSAERLLGRRVIGLPVPFTALFYCLSGGLPRDLLRTARAGISFVSSQRPCQLGELAGRMVDRELVRIANASAMPGDSAELTHLFRADVIAENGGLSGLGPMIQQHARTTEESVPFARTLANRAFHLDTVLMIFSSDLSREKIINASDPRFPGSFAALARVQREIGTADTLARATLERIREAWSLPPVR